MGASEIVGLLCVTAGAEEVGEEALGVAAGAEVEEGEEDE